MTVPIIAERIMVLKLARNSTIVTMRSSRGVVLLNALMPVSSPSARACMRSSI
jgi:hypothetical protein